MNIRQIKRDEFLDPDLFGNDAGEDEDIQRLNEYYLSKPEHEIFFDPKVRLQFVRARKGIGKSALLCFAAHKIQELSPDDIIINIKASDLIALFNSNPTNALEYINCWQQRICTRINLELGKKIPFAVSDDSMSLVESAELSNFKGKNIISALISRINISINSTNANLSPKGVQDNYAFLQRYSENQNHKVWLFIDDIDATFVDTPENRLLVSTFFSACRELTNTVKGINIRASIRTDVWSLICVDEALDKCEQYMLDLSWSTADTGKILCKKILSYYKEKQPDCQYCSYDEEKDFDSIYNIIFNNTLRWGNRSVKPYRPIHILSAGRPRWAAQLCKLAAKDAYTKFNFLIGNGNINFAMNEYGKYRLADLYKEHSHQCAELEVIIESFRNNKIEYRSFELIKHIDEHILSIVPKFTIDNVDISDALHIAKFLYRIGFITLRNDEFNKAAGFTRFEDAPNLLIPANYNESDLWVVHPAYRAILNLHD
ncbi:MAG: hypothetical protein SOV61_11740 [Lachnospiraceae bacterium]|nr:hypothetical protein [Lachnospiraceae bacterium]